MSKLTIKQDNFCLAYIETGNASEAYRRAFNASRMKPETVNRKAKEVLDSGKITARLTELRKPVVEKAQLTLEQHLVDLKRLRDAAESDAKYGPAIQAEVARGKASGFYVEKHMHSGDAQNPVVALIGQLNGRNLPVANDDSSDN